VKGDLKGSDPPRFIPKTCNLHTTFSAVSTEQMLEKLLGMKNLGISSLPLVGVEMEAGSFFFFFFVLLLSFENTQTVVMGRRVLVHRFRRSLPAKKNRTIYCVSPGRASGLWSSNFVF